MGNGTKGTSKPRDAKIQAKAMKSCIKERLTQKFNNISKLFSNTHTHDNDINREREGMCICIGMSLIWESGS